jgi:hypothetical protein
VADSTTETRLGDAHRQYAALCLLEFISDLFTAAGKETFSRDEILALLNCFKNDAELFDPQVVVAFDMISAEVEVSGQTEETCN